jgi:hypothetical protein
MLRIDRASKRLISLDTPTLADVSITERYDLQEFISRSPQDFFKEIGEELFLIGKEIEPSKNVQDRIDLLALDKEGSCVVIELKRGTHKLHMLQAISYAAMASGWQPDDFFQLLDEDQQEALGDFLEVERDQINRQQRVILIAETYDYGLLVATEWLSEKYGVDIICCRIAVATDPETKAEYLACSVVYPAPELTTAAVPRGRKRSTGILKWGDWDTALSIVGNPALVSYFQQQLKENREAYLRKRILHYRLEGKRRWFVSAGRAKAYVWQQGRFDGDLEFWRQRVSKPDDVKPVKNNQRLRFFIATDDDFRRFHQAVTNELASVVWNESALEDEIDEVEVVDQE